MTHVWWFRKWLGERKGQPCRVLCRGRNGNTLVEFADGFRVVSTRFCVRRNITLAQRGAEAVMRRFG